MSGSSTPAWCKVLKPASPVGIFFENVQPLQGKFEHLKTDLDFRKVGQTINGKDSKDNKRLKADDVNAASFRVKSKAVSELDRRLLTAAERGDLAAVKVKKRSMAF